MEAEETPSLASLLKALALTKSQYPQNFDLFFQNIGGKTDSQLSKEILILGKKSGQKSQHTESSRVGYLDIAAYSLKAILPTRVQQLAQTTKHGIRTQLLYNPEREDEDTVVEDVSLRELAQEFGDAVKSGVLMNNLLDLSEQALSVPPSRPNTSSLSRFISISRTLVSSIRAKVPIQSMDHLVQTRLAPFADRFARPVLSTVVPFFYRFSRNTPKEEHEEEEDLQWEEDSLPPENQEEDSLLVQEEHSLQ